MDPELFFPGKGESARTNEAIQTCFGCPVLRKCRDYRKRTGSTYGVWAAELYGRNNT